LTAAKRDVGATGATVAQDRIDRRNAGEADFPAHDIFT
jgi:hypothetical protein